MKRYFLLFFLIVSILVSLFAWQYWQTKHYVYQWIFDRIHTQKEVRSKAKIDELLASFEQIRYSKLPKKYRKSTKSEEVKYKNMLQQKEYYVLYRDDFFRYAVGDIRVHELLAHDRYYKASLKDKQEPYYWLISPKILHKLLELQNALEAENYNRKGFTLVNGHRNPAYNKQIGGASKSRHIVGEAIDIRINDIDKSGKYEEKDKDIVLDLLERKIIKSTGGIGRYPGTRSVHFDVRGHRARWDTY